MENVFKQYMSRHSVFMWDNLGDIAEGRGTLTENTYVLVYRLMAHSLQETLASNVGHSKADFFLYEAGRLAGYELAQNSLNLELGFADFAQQLAGKLLELKFGLLKVEAYSPETGDVTLTIENDISCSGMQNTNSTVCKFEEGFFGGVLYAYTGEDHLFEEVSCWSTGDRMCRFKGRIMR